MKSLILFLSLSFFALPIFAQKVSWRKIDQDYYGMKYKLPKSWAIDGFGSDDDWEIDGSSVCDCSGTINIGNRFEDNEIYMVIYPTKFKDSIDIPKRLHVWNMEFVINGINSTVKTKNCTFEKTVSKWTAETAGDCPTCEVWRLITSFENQYYVFYFWAKPEILSENEKLISQILDTFTPVKKD